MIGIPELVRKARASQEEEGRGTGDLFDARTRTSLIVEVETAIEPTQVGQGVRTFEVLHLHKVCRLLSSDSLPANTAKKPLQQVPKLRRAGDPSCNSEK